MTHYSPDDDNGQALLAFRPRFCRLLAADVESAIKFLPEFIQLREFCRHPPLTAHIYESELVDSQRRLVTDKRIKELEDEFSAYKDLEATTLDESTIYNYDQCIEQTLSTLRSGNKGRRNLKEVVPHAARNLKEIPEDEEILRRYVLANSHMLFVTESGCFVACPHAIVPLRITTTNAPMYAQLARLTDLGSVPRGRVAALISEAPLAMSFPELQFLHMAALLQHDKELQREFSKTKTRSTHVPDYVVALLSHVIEEVLLEFNKDPKRQCFQTIMGEDRGLFLTGGDTLTLRGMANEQTVRFLQTVYGQTISTETVRERVSELDKRFHAESLDSREYIKSLRRWGVRGLDRLSEMLRDHQL